MIVFSRIDDRLIHGQVVTTWVNNYNIEQIVVLNDEVAADDMQKNILTMAAPKGVAVRVFPVEKFAEILKKTKITRRTMLLFTTSVDVLRLVNLGVEINDLNVGGMRMNTNRTQITKSLSVDEEERKAFLELVNKGMNITLQMVPNDNKLNIAEVIK